MIFELPLFNTPSYPYLTTPMLILPKIVFILLSLLTLTSNRSYQPNISLTPNPIRTSPTRTLNFHKTIYIQPIHHEQNTPIYEEKKHIGEVSS